MERQLSEYESIPKRPDNQIELPTLITGETEFGRELLRRYQEFAGDNPSFEWNGKGSNVFVVGGLNKVLAEAEAKFRTPVPTDDVYGENGIFPLIKDRFYTDLNALDVWEERPEGRNLEVWYQALNLARQELGRQPTFPFRLQGFSCMPVSEVSDTTYGARIEPADNFRVIESDGLNYRGRFDALDENGLPIGLEEGQEGNYQKYSLCSGVSGVCLDWGGDLLSYGPYLGYSGGDGRVALVSSEESTPKK